MKKNETLKTSTYEKFWKQTSSTQTRLLLALENEKGQFPLVFLEPKVPVPKSVEDYKTSIFSFDIKKIHPIGQIDLDKKVGEMIYSSLTSFSMEPSKLQASLNNIHSQLLERISSSARDTKIKGLEDLVIKLGLDPKYIKEIEEIIKSINVDIQALRK